MKTVLVFGYGKSGKSVTKLLLKKNYTVYVYDEKNIDELIPKVIFINRFSAIPFKKIDKVILSPGIDVNSKKIQKLLQLGLPVESELSIGASFCKGKIFAVTGTNGKTTSVTLLHQIFEMSGKKSFLCGNVGIPISEIALNTNKKSYIVVEVSSFQLETTSRFNPYCTAILNITPDHLSRHKTFENYVSIKAKLPSFCKRNVFNFDDEQSLKIAKRFNCCTLFSNTIKLNGAYIFDNWIWYKKTRIINLNQIKLIGKKNTDNILAVVSMACLAKIHPKYINKAISQFCSLPHRIEYVLDYMGRTFINDSKSTNSSSTINAISAFANKSIILLLGGRDKDIRFEDIFNYSEKNNYKIKAVICFGECRNKIFEVCHYEKYICQNLRNATEKAFEISGLGDVILLSPACASYDEFENYEQRGQCFKNIAKEIKSGGMVL